jgi:hypothetical protein
MTDLEELKKLAADYALAKETYTVNRTVANLETATVAYRHYARAAVNALPGLIARVEENERLREALTFYAGRENYNDEPLPNNMWKTAKAVFDGGKRARAALRSEP